MPDRAKVDAFIACVVSGDHVGAIRDWYHENAWMRENVGARRIGRETLMEHEAQALARVLRVDTELLESPMIDGERVAIRWRFTFISKGQEPPLSMEEVAWQMWRGDRIAEEIFYYDPKQIGC
jgi:hypothetical protein